MIARAAALALSLLVGACAITPSSQPLPQLSAVPASFEMSGRLALRMGQRSEIAKLRWTHSRDRDTWVIASPLGNEVARIDADATSATLTQADGSGVQADSFADLTERVLGVALEPMQLAAWLHGATPSNDQGWTVTLDEKQPAGAVEIARRVSATRGETTVRLVVDEYRALGSP